MKRQSPQQIAKEIILGTLLGDSGIIESSHTKGYVKMCQGRDQFQYLIWKMKALKSLVGTFGISYQNKDKRDAWKSKLRIHVWSLSQAYLHHLYNDFYSNGVKIVRLNVLRRLTPLSLAVWYMDDGSIVYQKDTIYGCRLYTNGFSIEENQVIVDYMKESWGIIFNVLRDSRSDTYFLNARKVEAEKFLALVRPYIHESMKYKIDPFHYSAKHSVELPDEEIVRSLQECKELVRNCQSLSRVELTEELKSQLVEYLSSKNILVNEVNHWRQGMLKWFVVHDKEPRMLNVLKGVFGGNVSMKTRTFRYQTTEAKGMRILNTLGMVTGM
jgi:hypothetical protein